MTPKIEQYLSPIFEERKRKLLFELEKEEDKKLNSFQELLEQMNQSPQYNQSRQNLGN